MTEDFYLIAITALLPLTAGLLVCQVNPYHALVIRGILGAISALVYALFGAADVALTEALVGTMLSITLYAVAVRSSMGMRLGVLEGGGLERGLARGLEKDLEGGIKGGLEKGLERGLEKGLEGCLEEAMPEANGPPIETRQSRDAAPWLSNLSAVLHKYHMRLELVTYADPGALTTALMAKDIHGAHGLSESLHIRVQRLDEIIRAELPTLGTTYIDVDGITPPKKTPPKKTPPRKD